jgi:hypothetical protein
MMITAMTILIEAGMHFFFKQHFDSSSRLLDSLPAHRVLVHWLVCLHTGLQTGTTMCLLIQKKQRMHEIAGDQIHSRSFEIPRSLQKQPSLSDHCVGQLYCCSLEQ